MPVKYVCQVCGYVYDDGKEKAPFDSLPGSWTYPLCRAPKKEFRPEASAPASAIPAPAAPLPVREDAKLSPGQLAALCSNLARGCEKQYRGEEAGLFRQLAEWFASAEPPAEDASVAALAESLRSDAEAYPNLRASADAAGDRGAARICVWGEKVTRMLASLLSRYELEGEAMLEGQEIWVCTACGFVWIGRTPPEACPVCKVPAWKFEKAEGGVSA
jgi:rubrerythrin